MYIFIILVWAFITYDCVCIYMDPVGSNFIILVWTCKTKSFSLNRPPCKKACLRSFWPSKVQTSIFSYRDNLEYWNFACSKVNYYNIQSETTKAGMPKICNNVRFSCTEVQIMLSTERKRHHMIKNSEYDQEIPQSKTAENYMAWWGRATQQSRDTRETNKVTSSLFPFEMIATLEWT